MPLSDARKFVVEMRENQDFRNKTLATTGPEELVAFLQAEGLRFDQRELVGAMAECMAQSETQMRP